MMSDFFLIPVLAHRSIKGLSGFASGLLHPFLVPGHLLVLIGLGLAMGQLGYEGLRGKLYLFASSLLVGLAISRLVNISPIIDHWTLFLAVVSGMIVALQIRGEWRKLLFPLILLTGLLVGAGSAIASNSIWQDFQALTGSAIVAFVLVFYFAGLSGIIYLDWPKWMQIAVRTAGSWIVTIAILVLALQLTGAASIS